MGGSEGQWEGERRVLQEAAREALGPFLAQLIRPEYFATLTYDRRVLQGLYGARRRNASDDLGVVTIHKARRDAEQFWRDLHVALGRPISGVLAAEAHWLDGSQHLHGLLNTSGVRDGDIARIGELWRQGLDGLRRRGHGYARLEFPASEEAVSAYCAKYLTKAFGELMFSPQQLRPLEGGRPSGRRRRRRG